MSSGVYGPGNVLPGDAMTGPAPTSAGPHQSDFLNKLDPRVDSNLSKASNGGVRTGGDVSIEAKAVPRPVTTVPIAQPLPVVQPSREPQPLQEPITVGEPGPTFAGAPTMESEPSESHALAVADHAEKGAAQEEHTEAEVRDLGWDEHPKNVPTPLVGGLPNEELWTLVRRFNRQMYHVKATTAAVPGGLDLNIADEEEFSPDKLRANVERLYMTVIVGMAGFGKHIARLRSWKEPRRTAAFCTAYFAAWILNLVMPLILSTLLVLIVYPPSRPYLFPPAPLALVDSSTGGMKKPKAGVLGSHDSMTGAPEKHQGEAVEQEAHNFVSSFGAIALSSAAGKHPQNEPEHDQDVNASVPDPTSVAMTAADSKASTAGGTIGTSHDKTKQPMEAAMWGKTRPVMHILADIADGWERFANALSPTPPFPQEAPRLKLAAILIPALAVALITTPAMFIKMTHFSVGMGFFGDPVTSRALYWLNREFPHWQKLLEIRNTILKGVPTNAQLTITLLRIGEANKAPIPPPPRSSEPPSDKPVALHGDDVPMNVSHEEVQDAIHEDPSETTANEEAPEKEHKHHKGARIVAFFKGTTKTTVEAKLGVDKVTAKAGSKHARNRLGVLPKPGEPTLPGPVEFKGRYLGKKGNIYIITRASIPYLSFIKDSSSQPSVQIPVPDIMELKKIGGLGWKTKLIVGWATNREVADGLEVISKDGSATQLMAIPLREELFNRLVAMGGQKWESW
ncbi:MAG: hypothetical protein M1827_007125 [Pycnora praestabilis]|nr:MAG: hypothetical protein M1827_007125 [Pycnora praestabilis]